MAPPSPIAPPAQFLEAVPSDESKDEFECFRHGRRNPGRILDDTELSFKWTAEELENELGSPIDWVDPGLKVKVYIDDINNVEKVHHSHAISYTTEQKRSILAHAQHSEENFKAVKKEAEKIKISVNDKKTQLLCCLLYTSPSPRDLSTSRMPSSA